MFADYKPCSAGCGLRRRLRHRGEVLDSEELVGRGLGRGRLLQDQEGHRRMFPRVHGCQGHHHTVGEMEKIR